MTTEANTHKYATAIWAKKVQTYIANPTPVRETTTTTGTGAYTLLGAVGVYQPASNVYATDDIFAGAVTDGRDWEYGDYTRKADGTIARSLIEGSTNNGAAINWGAGTKTFIANVPDAREALQSFLVGYTAAVPATGTSGGVLGFTSTTVLASSVLLTLGAPVVGGGAGATPYPLAISAVATRSLTNTGPLNAAAWAQVDLTTGVSAVLPTANGGTGADLSAGASGGIPFFNATGVMGASAVLPATRVVLGGGAGGAPNTSESLVFDGANLGIGTNAPTNQLHVKSDAVGTPRGILISEHSTGAAGGGFFGRKSRGTFASPTTVVTGDFVAAYGFAPYVPTSGYMNTTFFGARVNGTITATSAPTDFFISTGSTNDTNPFVSNRVRLLVNSVGAISIGSNANFAATARLHIQAGAAPAGTAPLKFTLPGVPLSIVEAGVLETDANYLYWTNNTPSRKWLAMSNAALTTGLIPVATTTGYLQDGPAYAGGILTAAVTGALNGTLGATTPNTISATTGAFSTSAGQILDLNSSNASGGYLTWGLSGTAKAYVGAAKQLAGALANDDFGIDVRGGGNFYLMSGGTTQFQTGASVAYFPTVGTTASAANAFLDSGSSPVHSLLRSTSSMRYKNFQRFVEPADAISVVMRLAQTAMLYTSRAPADDPRQEFYGMGAELVDPIDPRLVTRGRFGVAESVQYERIAVPMSVMLANHEARLRAAHL